jgi:hypothetical protein
MVDRNISNGSSMAHRYLVYSMDHWDVGLMASFWKVMLILAIALFVAYLLSPGAEAVVAPGEVETCLAT